MFVMTPVRLEDHVHGQLCDRDGRDGQVRSLVEPQHDLLANLH